MYITMKRKKIKLKKKTKVTFKIWDDDCISDYLTGKFDSRQQLNMNET